MTEPQPEYFIDGEWPDITGGLTAEEYRRMIHNRWDEPSESDIQNSCVKALRKAGAKVIVTSQDRRTRKQLASIPDVIVFWHGHTLLLEFKGPRGTLNEDQLTFYFNIREHLGAYLHYAVIRSMADLNEFLRDWHLPDLAKALEGE